MIKIEHLKDYLNCSSEEFVNLATKIYMITDFISEDYPKYKEWYFTKQLLALLKDKRRS